MSEYNFKILEVGRNVRELLLRRSEKMSENSLLAEVKNVRTLIGLNAKNVKNRPKSVKMSENLSQSK